MEAVSSVLAVTDQDANPATAARFGVRSIPTFLFFKDGELVEKKVGIVLRAGIKATLASLA